MHPVVDQLAAAVPNAHEVAALARPLLDLLQSVTGLESTYLTAIDLERGEQHILHARNRGQLQIPEGLSVPWDDSLCKRALEQNCHYTDRVGEVWGDSAAARALGIVTYLSEPVRDDNGRLFGTLCGASSARVPLPTGADHVLKQFARLIAQQLERERAVRELRRANAELAAHALVDPLTGVANRRALLQELQRLLAQAERGGERVLVGFIDLDGFKAINDHHGHQAGDRFLAAVAARLSLGLRDSDRVARYGGDEFVVLAPLASAAPGHADDDFRARLEQLTRGRFPLGDGEFDYPGASVGVVASAPGERDADALLARADAAMYQAKRQRRAQATASG